MVYTKQELLEGFCEMTKYDGSVTKQQWFQDRLTERVQFLKKQMKNNVIRYLNSKDINVLIQENDGVELD